MTIRTQHGNSIDNWNRLGRAPRVATSQSDLALLSSPEFPALLRRARAEGSPLAHETDLALRHAERVFSGARTRPGEMMGTDSMPTIPMPFAPTETPHPSLSDPAVRSAYETAVSNVKTDSMTRALQAKMGTDAAPLEPSVWDRMAPAPSSAPDREPTLRESISGAMDALSPSKD